MAFDQCKQSVVFADADIGSGVELGTALAPSLFASGDVLAAEGFDAEHFGIGIAAVTR
jgi:hypothetical protein